MKKAVISIICLFVGLSSGLLLQAQSVSCCQIHEPENHTIVVERLMRYHDSREYERQIRQVVNNARHYLELRLKRLT